MKNIYLFMLVCALTTFQKANCQKPFSGDLMVNPMTEAANRYNATLQVQSSFVPDFALNGGLGYQFNTAETKDFVSNSATTTKFFEVRYFPYGQRFISFKKKSYIREVCNGKFHCLRSFGLTKALLHEQILRGFYVAPGFESQHTTLELDAKTNLDPTQNKYNFDIKNKAFTLAVGFQMRLTALTLGVGYRVSIGNPKAAGDFNVLKDQLFTTIHPIKARIEQGVRVEVGLNF